MECLDENYFLMIEPDAYGLCSSEPLEDELTKKVDLIFSLAIEKYRYRGMHMTKCGKLSDNIHWELPNGMITNNLAGYYIRYYRDYIYDSEIEKIHYLYNLLIK